MSKPSILLINRVYPPVRGATGRMMQDLACALVENGWQVTVLSTCQQIPTDLPKNIYYEVIRTKLKPRRVLGCGWILTRLCIRGLRLPRHDIVLTMTDPPMLVWAGRYIAGFKKSKHIHWCQDLYPDLLPVIKVKLPKFIIKRFNKILIQSLRKAKHTVAIGHCMSNRLQKKGIMPNKISVIPNWADFEVISPSVGHDYTKLPEKINAVAKRPEEMFRDDSPKFRVLYAGTIGRAHPIRSVIEAAEILAPHKEIEFVFVGEQAAHSFLAHERAKRELENIKFIPYQPIEKLRTVMESGDVHLVSMREEARGMLVPCKFYAGLTVGRPTIFVGPKNCEVADVISKYKAGVVVSPSDGQALADAIYRYRVNGDLWFSTQGGALQAAQAYHPNKSLQDWIDLLEGMRVS